MGVHYEWSDIFRSMTKQKHKFTLDVHLAHYILPILKQCKQVTYAFKTPLTLAHPPKSLPSGYLGGVCHSANVAVPGGCKQPRSGLTWERGEFGAPFPSLRI